MAICGLIQYFLFQEAKHDKNFEETVKSPYKNIEETVKMPYNNFEETDVFDNEMFLRGGNRYVFFEKSI